MIKIVSSKLRLWRGSIFIIFFLFLFHTYLNDLAMNSTSCSKIQFTSEWQSIFSGSQQIQVVCHSQITKVCSVTSYITKYMKLFYVTNWKNYESDYIYRMFYYCEDLVYVLILIIWNMFEYWINWSEILYDILILFNSWLTCAKPRFVRIVITIIHSVTVFRDRYTPAIRAREFWQWATN